MVRSFDRDLLEVLLADVAQAPAFDAARRVARDRGHPRRPDSLRVRRFARGNLWQSWWREEPAVALNALPLALDELLRRVAGAAERRGDDVERLAALASLKASEAETLFDRLYRRADQAFDLSACQTLLDILEEPERTPLITSSLRRRRDDRRQYLRARGRWSAEDLASGRYLVPAGVEERYAELLGPNEVRMLNLHARGGSGKTAQLNWLIGRRLVPDYQARGRIACAKVDFDTVDPVQATIRPWLVMAEIAAQLDDQLPDRPFGEFLDEFEQYTPLLRPPSPDDDQALAAARLVASLPPDFAEQAMQRFRSVLAEGSRNRPVVLILDTLEEIHLRPDGNLAALFSAFASILVAVPSVRMVLAGRHPIEQILGDVSTRLSEFRTVTVKAFTRDEADRYLSSMRGLESADVREAIVAKAGGDPFLLAMLADVAQGRPGMLPAEFADYEADLVYLVRRVIRRIQEPGVRLAAALRRGPARPELRVRARRHAAVPPAGDGGGLRRRRTRGRRVRDGRR